MEGHIRKATSALLVGLLLVPIFALEAPAAPGPSFAPEPPDPGNFTLPNGTLPNGTLPNGTLPNGTLPNGTLPNGTLPNGTLPNGTLPNGSLPGFNLPRFTNVTVQAGLGAYSFSRLAWGDYDSDGFDDILFNGGYLFHNERTGVFTDVSLLAGTRGNFAGGVWGDYNNDGWLDFYAYAWRETWDTLFRNNGDGTFTNVTNAAGGLTDDLPTEAAAWADYDRDGCLDLYVANYEWPPLDDQGTDSAGTPNILWHNNCDGTFSNATVSAGVVENYRSRGVVWGDVNNDNWPDLYVSNYRLDPNELWMNNRNGTFTNLAQAKGVDCDNATQLANPSGACGHSIGSDFADFNNDGNMDLYVANLAHPQFLILGHDTSQMYRNGGAPNYNFQNIREASGVRYCETASDPTFGDFDADGRPDLFISSIYENRTNNLFVNDGAGHFTDVTARTGVDFNNGWGAGWSDFDRDGDLDLLVGSGSGVRLYRNEGNGNAYIELELKGKNANRAGIGARVYVTTGRDTQMQEVQGGDGTGSQSSLRLFFGLGSMSGNVAVTVRWPSGLTQNLTLPINQISVIQEPEGVVDLAVTALSASPANPVVNSQSVLTATVENVGTAVPSSAQISFYRDSPVAANKIGPTLAIGRLVGSQDFSVVLTAPASPGPLTLLARLESITPEDQTPANDQRAIEVVVRASNIAPVANLSANPSTVSVGVSVLLDGSNSTDDSRINQYIFDFGDGASALENVSTVNHTYTQVGTYTARLTVIDDDGTPSSNTAEVEIAVAPPGAQPPVAVIDSITPASPEMSGARVTFTGHGVATDAAIAEYRWESDISGLLSAEALFSTNALGLGNHTIRFTVQDTNGLVSQAAIARFLVVASGDVVITFREIVNDSVIAGPQTMRGAALSVSGASVVQIQWKVDQTNLQTATLEGGGEWSFPLDASAYTEGSHDITVVVTDSAGLLTTRTIHVMFAKGAAPPVGSSNLAYYAAAGGAGLAIAALALILSARRRRPTAVSARGPGVTGRSAPRPPRPPAPAAAPPKRRMKARSLETKQRPPP